MQLQRISKSKKIAAILLTFAAQFAVLMYAPTTHAQDQWPIVVLASNAKVRLEVQPTAYDAQNRKYKYRFSWLMPKYRTYSITIDDKAYQTRLTKNGTVETDFWFSPDITYRIKIFPYANGKGKAVGEGTFTAPSATPPVSEDVLLQSYIDSYPALPTQEVSSPEDVAAILTLGDNTDIVEFDFEALRPYLSAQSIELLTKTPKLVEFFEADRYKLYAQKTVYPKVTVLAGKQYAILNQTTTQPDTNYSEDDKVVVVKENGSWKIDFVGSLRLAFDELKQENPTDADVTGSGSTNISITGMEYEFIPEVNDTSNRFLVQIKNNGTTTVHRFAIAMDISGSDVYSDTIPYKLAPGEEVIVSLPTAPYWSLQGVNKQPGEYRTDVAVGFDSATDTDYADNYFYSTDRFE